MAASASAGIRIRSAPASKASTAASAAPCRALIASITRASVTTSPLNLIWRRSKSVSTALERVAGCCGSNSGSTRWAQGGIAAVLSVTDSFESHVEDTLEAGAGLCDEDVVRFTVEHGPEAIQWLIDYRLRTRERAEKDLDFIDHYRGYVINYNLGKDMVSDYVERAGEDLESRWAAFIGLLSTPRLPGDL